LKNRGESEEELLEVEVAGIRMKNPLILASGVLGSYASSLNRISKNAGAVVSKSVGIDEIEGYKNPTIINYPHGIINAVGLSSPGAKRFYEELKRYKGDAPLIVSIVSTSPEGFAEVVKHFPIASAFELNLSCPHVKNFGLSLGSNPKVVREVVRSVKKVTKKPVFVKLSPNVEDIVTIGKSAEKAGADGVVAINTLKGMAIDIYTRKPILSNISGGVSGEGIKPIALKCVWDLYEELNIPIIGAGGITTWKDVIEFLLAGASAVQIGSAFYYSHRYFYSIKESLIAYARWKEENLSEIIGKAHQ